MENNDNKLLAQWATDYALKKGASQASVKISNGSKTDIEFRDQKLDKISQSTENSLSIALFIDNKYSSHSTNDLRKDKLEKFIDTAVAGTKYLSRDEHRYLPDPSMYPMHEMPPLHIYDEGYHDLSPEKKLELAQKAQYAAESAHEKVISAAGSYYDYIYDVVKVNSNGFVGEGSGTTFRVGAEVTVKDKDSRPEDYNSERATHFAHIGDPEAIGKYCTEKALNKIGQEKINSGNYTMITENIAMFRLISMLLGPMSGRSIQQKRSFLEGKMNSKIASDKFTIYDDPFVEYGLGSRHWDNEGLAAKRFPLIENGILKNYYIDTYYGRKLDMDPTTGGSSNLVFNTGDNSIEEMIKGAGKAILVKSLIGGNSNSTTGDFSFGISGALVENGKLVKPISEMNISGNAVEFWNKLVEVGNDPYAFSSWRVPSMVFDDIDFSGV